MDPIINAIDMLNAVGQRFCAHAGSVLIQSSLLIAVLVIADVLLRRRVRAVVRHALWMLVFVKLLLPPGLSLRPGSVTTDPVRPSSFARWPTPLKNRCSLANL